MPPYAGFGRLAHVTAVPSKPAVESGGCGPQLAVHLARRGTKNQATQRIPAPSNAGNQYQHC